MKIYFVRHGESALTEKRHQLPDTPLSDLGILQTRSVAKRLVDIPIDLILSSPYLRAVQTAQSINKIKNLPIITNKLIIERKMPSSF